MGGKERRRKREGQCHDCVQYVNYKCRSTESVRSASCGCLNRSNFMIGCVYMGISFK